MNLLKKILTKLGLKPIILFFLHSKLWRNHLFPIFFFINKLPLRAKYYKLIRVNKLVPTNHLVVLSIIQKLSKIYEPLGIKFFLTGGLLLGGVRQGAFAGTPGDIDLGLIDVHFSKFYENINLIEKNFVTSNIKENVDKASFKIIDPDFSIIQKNIKHWTQKKSTFYRFEADSIQFMLKNILVDINFFSLKKINDKYFWVGRTSKLPHVHFSRNDLLDLDNINLYGINFLAPKNPSNYLDTVFGVNWKIPNKKQFIWKNKF